MGKTRGGARQRSRPGCDPLGAFALFLIIAVLYGIAVVNDWEAIDRLIIALTLLLFLSWVWSRFSLQRIGLRRELMADRVRAGEEVTERLTLTNHAALPKLWIELRDYSTLPQHQVSRAMHIRRKQSVTWQVQTPALRRGKYRLGPIVVASGDPLGLFSRQKSLPGSHEVLVLPATVDVSTIRLPADQLSGGDVVARITSATSPSIAGIREYVTGDPLNRISWSATARRGALMVKEFEPDPAADLIVLVDLNDEALRGISEIQGETILDSTEEYAVSIAASLVERALHDGRRVGLVINRAMPVRILAESSQRQWLRIFETLAVATSFGHRSLQEAIAAESSRLSRMTTLVIVTATRDTAWSDAVRGLTERRIPVSVVLIDDPWDSSGDSGIDLLEQALLETRATVIRYPTGPGVMQPAGAGTRRS